MTHFKRIIGLSLLLCAYFNSSFAQDNRAEFNPPRLVKGSEISQKHSIESRKFSGISSLAVSPKGRIWAVWYAGITPGEDLKKGNLLLVKHGPIAQKIGRSHLMAFISKDDGHSWSDGLLLDERPGVSYADVQQTSYGTIYITYDFNRTVNQDILMTHFSESDILSERNSEMILKVFNNRKLISTCVR